MVRPKGVRSGETRDGPARSRRPGFEIINVAGSSDDEGELLRPFKRRYADPDEEEEKYEYEDENKAVRPRAKERPRNLDPNEEDEEIEVWAARLELTYVSGDDLESIGGKDEDEESVDGPPPANDWRPGLYIPLPEIKVEDEDRIAGMERRGPASDQPYEPDDDSSPHPSSPHSHVDELDEDVKHEPVNGKVLAPGEDLEPATLTPLCLPPVDCKVDNHWVYLFFRFSAERHAMYTRHKAGVARDKLTDDETMTSIHIGNVYRQLDPSSAKMRDKIIGVGDQSVEEVCFRVFLYCMFYKDPTWEALCRAAGGIPSWKNFEADLPVMEAALHQMSIVERQKLWYGGFQLVPPTIYFSRTYRNRGKDLANYAASLRLVMAIMKAGIPARLTQCTYAIDASYVLETVPTLGGFLSLNILCFLNDTTHFKWLYRDFATCGPGPRKFMQRMFGKHVVRAGAGMTHVINSVAMEEAGLRWLADNQWRYWARLGLEPPHEWEHGLRPGLRVLDVENALCWAHRYVNAYEVKRTRSLADEPAPIYDPEVTENCGPPAWCVEERWLESTSRAPWDADHAEADDRVESIGDNIYEIEKVVARLGNVGDQDGRFRVRWTGWTPEWDTWERASSLREDAEEASFLGGEAITNSRLWRSGSSSSEGSAPPLRTSKILSRSSGQMGGRSLSLAPTNPREMSGNRLRGAPRAPRNGLASRAHRPRAARVLRWVRSRCGNGVRRCADAPGVRLGVLGAMSSRRYRALRRGTLAINETNEDAPLPRRAQGKCGLLRIGQRGRPVLYTLYISRAHMLQIGCGPPTLYGQTSRDGGSVARAPSWGLCARSPPKARRTHLTSA